MLTESDRDLIDRARELPPDVTMDALRRLTRSDARASDEMVLRESVGIAGFLLAELADRFERLDRPGG